MEIRKKVALFASEKVLVLIFQFKKIHFIVETIFCFPVDFTFQKINFEIDFSQSELTNYNLI